MNVIINNKVYDVPFERLESLSDHISDLHYGTSSQELFDAVWESYVDLEFVKVAVVKDDDGQSYTILYEDKDTFYSDLAKGYESPEGKDYFLNTWNNYLSDGEEIYIKQHNI